MSLRSLAVGTLVACSLIVVAGCAPKESPEPAKSASTTPAVVEEPAKIAETAPAVVEEPAKIAETAPAVVEEPTKTAPVAPPVVEKPALPAPAANGKVKVFILAGQSNMEGAGWINMDRKRNNGQGTLEYMAKHAENKANYSHLVDEKGDWFVRDDVWVWFLGRKGCLTPGFGAGDGKNIGPELGFGLVMGEYCADPVLLIKTAWGGKTLAGDFRPPSSGPKPNTGKTVGPYYTETLQLVRTVLKDLKTLFPAYDGKGYEIAGFGWHQGWNDGCSLNETKAYEKNMVNFIRDIRKDLGTPGLPFVIGGSGFGGWSQTNTRRLGIMNAQEAAANQDEFKDNVRYVETRGFFRGANVSPRPQRYHWCYNAESYYLIGEAMGLSMVELMGGPKAPPTPPKE